VAVKNKLIGELQRRAVNVANGYKYAVKCSDDLFCDYATRLWAYELAEVNTSCAESTKLLNCISNLNLPSCNSKVTQTTNCSVAFTDTTVVVSCTTITFSDLNPQSA
jgi:hypothetical protein